MSIADVRTETRGFHDGARVPLPLRLARRARWVVAALAVLAGFALLAPAQAQSVKVSNIAQTSATALTTSISGYATAFTTGGTSTARYTLNNVILDVGNTGSGQLTVSIHNASGSNPGTKIGNNLSGTIGSNAGHTTYTASGITLNGATTYFVYVAQGGTRTLGTTASDAESSGSTTGWSIANTGRRKTTAATNWHPISTGRSLRFTVNATTQASSGSTCAGAGNCVSNIAQTSATALTTSISGYATAFTTGGTSTARYTLNNVILDVGNTGSGQLTVSIHNASGSNPGTKIGNNLSGTIGSNAGHTTYTASGITLNGATTYFVYVAQGGTRTLGTTASDAESSGSTTGWSIANTGRRKTTAATNWHPISTGRSLRFTVNAQVPDATAPTVATNGYSPADGATGVPRNANLVLTFSEAVKKGTGDIEIIKTSDTATKVTISVTGTDADGTVSVSGRTVTINPASNLAASTGYHVNIDSGAIKDLANNNHTGITGTTAWNFTTGTTTLAAPTLTTSNLSGATYGSVSRSPPSGSDAWSEWG